MHLKMTVACLAAGLMSAALAVPPAFANGGLFFEDEEAHEESGTPYYGFVRDPSGIGIKDAVVTLRVRSQNLEYVSQTNTLGRYRSAQIGKDVDPRDVEVIIGKPGFRELNKVNRTRGAKAGQPIEINFTLKRDDQAAK